MIILLCLVGIVGLGQCQNEVPSRIEIETSINRTIDEVERMIKEDPRLPRLSRGQIVDILFNITANDANSYTDPSAAKQVRADYQRSLMVVLPYDAKNSQDNLMDLYTKPPIIQMVTERSESSSKNVQMITENGNAEEIVYPEGSRESNFAMDSSLNNFVVPEIAVADSKFGDDDDDDEEMNLPVYQNHRDTYSDVIDPTDLKTVSADGKRTILKSDKTQKIIYAETPEKFSFDLNNLQTSFSTTPAVPEDAKDPVAIFGTAATDERDVGMTMSVQGIEEYISKGSSTTESTPTTTENLLTSDKWRYNAPPETNESPTKTHGLRGGYGTSTSRVETIREETNTSPPMHTTMKKSKRPNVQKLISEKMRVVKAPSPPSPVYVTPMTADTVESVEKNESSVSYTAMYGESTKSTVTMPPMRPEVEQLLASIGLTPDGSGKQPVVETNLRASEFGQSFRPHIAALDAVAINSPSILNQNTFGPNSFEMKPEAQSLTPDMQLLLQKFGLQTSKQMNVPSTTRTTTTTTTTTTTKKPPALVDVNSYSKFKPLPTATVENNDMRDFLAKFGLGVDDEKNRGQKSIKTRKNAETSVPSIIEAVPDNMKKILENIGLISRSQKSVEVKSITSYIATSTAATPLNVFKPHETPGHSDEQKNKIEKLLDTVRQVQAGQADSNDVQKAAKELLETTKTLQNGPDPMALEEILQIYNEGLRNEVKRQEDATTLTTTTTTTTTTTPTPADDDTDTPVITEGTTTTSSTTMASTTFDTRNIMALADSFGGSTQAPDPALPAQRNTGLYFLVDWNTFLEVGEDGKADKVNLRFQPKVGDRSRFIPVTVP